MTQVCELVVRFHPVRTIVIVCIICRRTGAQGSSERCCATSRTRKSIHKGGKVSHVELHHDLTGSILMQEELQVLLQTDPVMFRPLLEAFMLSSTPPSGSGLC